MKRAAQARTWGRKLPVSTDGMALIPGGTFSMGSENFYPEEQPVRRVRVDPFWVDRTPVTNRQFSAQRVEMLQWWSDQLDALKAGAEDR